MATGRGASSAYRYATPDDTVAQHRLAVLVDGTHGGPAGESRFQVVSGGGCTTWPILPQHPHTSSLV
jgi:hypothetical protein